MPKLIVEKGPDKGRVIHVQAGTTVTVGRDRSATVRIRDTMSSRGHFKIVGRGNEFRILDLGSLNGTIVNGERITDQKLNSGDLIMAGESTLSFLADDQGDARLLGKKMGGYRVLERVGRGGMGTVYRAEQLALKRTVALKVISEEHTKNREFMQLFLHEAQTSARLNHPNIVQVYDVKQHEQFYYFSMEFMPGGSVQDLLNKERKVPVGRAVKMIREAAQGLEYAQKKEIIHRDIKPDNLMISEEGEIKIGDLGLARSPKEKVGPKEEGTVIGTPHYIAPEQVKGKPADYRSDLYSLGSTFYRIVTGTTPYQASSIRELVNRKVREDPKAPHEVNPDVPKRVSDIILKLMARNPEDRHVSATELLRDLENLQRPRGGGAQRVSGGRETPKSNRNLMVGTAAGLLVLAVAAVFGLGAILKDGKGGDPAAGTVGPSSHVVKTLYTNAQTFELKKQPIE